MLLGAVGGPKWNVPNRKVRPEQGLLDLRAALSVYANLRPVAAHPALYDASPLRAERLQGRRHDGRAGTDRRHLFRREDRAAKIAPATCAPTTRDEIERVVRMAAELAQAGAAS